MDKSILSDANKRFTARDYAEALALYEQAGAKYGMQVVEVNIALCRKALSGSLNSAGTAQMSAPPSNGDLDPATKYLLGRAGAITLTDVEEQACLDLHAKLTSRKSVEAATKPVNPIPADWPEDLLLAPLPESTNDFLWNRRRKGARSVTPGADSVSGLSIVIPTFNRSKILDVTLACLVNQVTRFPFEVIVADDGSKDAVEGVVRCYEPRLDIKYVRQKDYGYQLCAVRNLGLRTARYDYVAILDCDMAPNPRWVESYMQLLMEDDNVALVGPRKYVDTNGVCADEFLHDRSLLESLPEVRTNNAVAGKSQGEISVDWRIEHFRETEDLRLCNTPFRYFSGGNVAFARKWLEKAGWFDEEFNQWGGEDNEFGYRLYRAGCYFRAVSGAMAYHQEPPGKENETDRGEGKKVTAGLVQDKVPYFYRRVEPLYSSRIHARPLVSIYVPAYNCAQYIERCVDSALNQTVVDLEVCICDDGSTDHTLDVLNRRYGGNPRVRVITKTNGGIGSASNAAVRLARGYYIGQLDSDDYLEPDAVEICLREFKANLRLACVYTTNRNVNPDGSLIANGYNWPLYSREKLTTAMIAHHFRMFTIRAWNLTDGFDEKITNAVDYDMYLKLSEVGPFKHINRISYNRVLHGENTSVKKLAKQKENHYIVVNQALARQGVKNIACVPESDKDDACRKYRFKRYG